MTDPYADLAAALGTSRASAKRRAYQHAYSGGLKPDYEVLGAREQVPESVRVPRVVGSLEVGPVSEVTLSDGGTWSFTEDDLSHISEDDDWMLDVSYRSNLVGHLFDRRRMKFIKRL